MKVTNLLIERYLTDDMSPSEKLKFEAIMAENKELASEVKLRNEVDAAISDNDLMAFIDTLNKLRTEAILKYEQIY